jgi:hypothetical protein
MSGHTDCSEQGRNLCDALWRELVRLRPGLSRSESANWCSFYLPPKGRIAYIKHRKGFLRVYFRSNPDTSLASLPPSLQLYKREQIQSAWAERFAFSFQISSPEHVLFAAQFLSDVAYPLATAGSKDVAGGNVSALSPEVMRAQHDWDFILGSLEDERERVLRAILLRQGQPDFRSSLVAAYGGRCAITGCDALPALEAAHIISYCGPQSNHVSNGLLLRADVHTLFDLDLIGIHSDCLEVAVAPSLEKTVYAKLAGSRISTPERPELGPNRDALTQRWSRFVVAKRRRAS